MKINKVSIYTLFLATTFTFTTSCKEQKKENTNEETTQELAVDSTKKWSERMALSIIYRNPEAWQIDHAKRPKWDYVHGLVSLSMQALYKETSNDI